MQIKDDLQALSGVIRELRDEVREARDSRHTDLPTTVSSIQVHAGGAATWLTAWVSTVAAALMLGMAIVGSFWVSTAFQQADQERAELRSQISDLNDYIHAIYQVAPQLQKELEKQKDKDN